jgi:hypothetical protein
VLVALTLVVAAAWRCWTQRDRPLGSGVAVAVIALATGYVTVALLPVSQVLGVAAHQVRPVWPIVLFATAVVVATLLRTVPHGERALPVLVAVLVLLALPAHNPRTGPSTDEWAIPIVRDLVDQMDEVDDAGLVLVDLSVIRFAEPYSTPVLLELQRRGVEFVVDDQIAVGQLGPRREHEAGDPVDRELRIVDGVAALEPEPGWERIAFVAGLEEAEQRELDALEARQASGEPLTPAEEDRRADLDHRRLFESAAVLVRELP